MAEFNQTGCLSHPEGRKRGQWAAGSRAARLLEERPPTLSPTAAEIRVLDRLDPFAKASSRPFLALTEGGGRESRPVQWEDCPGVRASGTFPLLPERWGSERAQPRWL